MKVFLIVYAIMLPFILLYPMANRIEKVPMKAYPVINIPDGEFLRYGNYTRGEKTYDVVFVAKIITNENGNVLYRIYSDMIAYPGGKKPQKDYTKWPSYYLIDPQKGLVLEVEQYLSTNSEEMKNNTIYGMGDTFYTHYILHQDTGNVEYKTKGFKDNGIIESSYKAYIKPGYSAWEGGAYFMFSPRFMDPKSGGIMYLVAPAFLKDPVPITIMSAAKEIIETTAGTFNVIKVNTIMADPFIGKLMEPIIKSSGYWIEDSDRKLLIKIKRSADNESTLDEISNVNIK